MSTPGKVMSSHLWLSLRYASAMPVRITLATAMLLRALLILPVGDRSNITSILFNFLPPFSWAGIFGVNGLLLMWRILDRKQRPEITRATNALTCGVLGAYFFCVVQGLGYVPPGSADTIALLVAAIWATLRTDLTQNDRETA